MTCAECRYFQRSNDAAGRCHRNAPLVIAAVQAAEDWKWPSVSEDDWCGKYAPRKTEQQARPFVLGSGPLGWPAPKEQDK